MVNLLNKKDVIILSSIGLAHCMYDQTDFFINVID